MATIVLLATGCIGAVQIKAQVVYGVCSIFNSVERYLVKINLATCEVCVIQPELIDLPTNPNFTFLADGSVLYYVGSLGQILVEPPPGSNVIWSGNAGPIILDGVLAPDGLVYMTSPDLGLYTFNPVTYATSYIGPWPAGGGCQSLYLINGEVHGGWFPNFGGPWYDITVNLTDPAASTFNYANPPYQSFYQQGITWNGVAGVLYLNFNGAGSIEFFNPNDFSIQIICNFSPPLNFFSISEAPPGLPEFDCIDPCVTTVAGEFPSPGPFTGCNTIYFPAVINFDLNPFEGINYILYTNPANPLASILATSTGSYVFFNPATMQTGIDYYVAAIAGDMSGGIVNLTDPCLDISDPVVVRFTDRPGVTFSGSLLDICPGGCQTLTATFTGTPPFTLNGEVRSGATVLSTFNASSATNTGTFQVCIPPNVPPGSLQVMATSLTDANCSCN